MKKQSNAWIVSLVVFVIWLVIVIGGELLAVGGDPTGLDALVHGLWDFSVFSAGKSPLGNIGLVFPIIFFIYGLWLLKDYRHGEAATDPAV